jgi:O-acetyl-ADP-ribose deacetylase (regulator of RNase III)
VGPVVAGDGPTRRDEGLLASCYRSCLDLAAARGLHSVAFCCISTGEFRFPNALAARVAVGAVRDWLRRNPSDIEVTFDVFKPVDERLYRELLAGD